MTVFGDVNDDRFLPSKHKITDGSTDDHCQTQPHIVRHENQHEQKAQRHLYDVQKCLINMNR